MAKTKELKKRHGARRGKNHHVSFGKSRLARAALPFQRAMLVLPPESGGRSWLRLAGNAGRRKLNRAHETRSGTVFVNCGTACAPCSKARERAKPHWRGGRLTTLCRISHKPSCPHARLYHMVRFHVLDKDRLCDGATRTRHLMAHMPGEAAQRDRLRRWVSLEIRTPPVGPLRRGRNQPS